jgi:hypothetical protein
MSERGKSATANLSKDHVRHMFYTIHPARHHISSRRTVGDKPSLDILDYDYGKDWYKRKTFLVDRSKARFENYNRRGSITDCGSWIDCIDD